MDDKLKHRQNLLSSIKFYIKKCKQEKHDKSVKDSFEYRNKVYKRNLQRMKEKMKNKNSYLNNHNPQGEISTYEKGIKEFKQEIAETQKQCVMLLKQPFKVKS